MYYEECTRIVFTVIDIIKTLHVDSWGVCFEPVPSMLVQCVASILPPLAEQNIYTIKKNFDKKFCRKHISNCNATFVKARLLKIPFGNRRIWHLRCKNIF